MSRGLGGLGACVLGAVMVVWAAPTAGASDVGPTPQASTEALVVVDEAAAAGLSTVQKSWSASAVDYDLDGDEDVWIGYHQWTGKLWSNDGDGTYTWVARSAWPRLNSEGKVPDRHDCTWADVDRNGLPDAYCSAGRNQGNVVKYRMDNELWLQTSPGQFSEVGTTWGVGDLCGRGRHVVFLDANGDQYPDLFLGNQSPRKRTDPCDNPANGLPSEQVKLFLNVSGTHFVEAAGWGISGYNAGQRCAEVLDFDGDGWQDLLACRFKDNTPRLYQNNGGTGFTDVAYSRGLTTAVADAVVVDLDRDGDPDLVTAGVREFAYRINTGGRFGAPVRMYAVPTGMGRSVAVGDVDGDGDLDVYAMVAGSSASVNPNDVLLVNDGMRFTPVPVPAASGTADEVIALHPHGGGRTEFLVLNGGELVGPVQLITVRTAANLAPVARIAQPVACGGLTCTFDGSASADPDGAIVTFDWAFGDGTTEGGAVVEHTYADSGSYEVTLRVVDDDGASASATVTLTVGAS